MRACKVQTQISIIQDLRLRLASGEFPNGTRVRPENLCKTYGCSASSMREVLMRLSAEGLVDHLEQRGFRVPKHSAKLLSDLTRFRIILETEGACLSIRHGGIGWESRLAGAHHKLTHLEKTIADGRASDDVMRFWAAAELEFHQTLIEDCGSEELRKTHTSVCLRFRQQNFLQDREFTYLAANIIQHSDILAAALDHDEELLCERISEHLMRNIRSDTPMPVG